MTILKIICASFLLLALPSITMEAPQDLSRQLAIAAYEGNLTAVQQLIAAGADPNQPSRILEPQENNDYYDRLGEAERVNIIQKERLFSPLGWAIEGNHESICKFLLDWGINPNADISPFDVRTPIARAAMAKNDDPSICLLLLRYGADINKETPLVYAAGRNNQKICEFLLQRGAVFKMAAFGFAALAGHTATCAFFISQGHDVNYHFVNSDPGWLGTTPFFFVVKRMTQTRLSAHVRELFKLFISGGANVNDRDGANNTPLIYATDTFWRWFFPIELLLEAGADPRLKNNNGDTALMICARSDEIRFYNEQRNIVALIANPIFNPVVSDSDIQDSCDRIFTALLTLKRVCPCMPKDLRTFLLYSIPETKRDCLNAGLFKRDERFAPHVPLQTAHKLICCSTWNKDKVIGAIKAHHYACMKPLMA